MPTHARTIVGATTLLGFAGASVGYGQDITSIERVGISGQPYSGQVWTTDLPKVDAFTLLCPSDTFSKQIMSEATVRWSATLGTSAGVEWGPVKAAVETSMGVEIGVKKSITRTYNYGPIPWFSRRYCIMVAYGKFRIKGTDRSGKAFDVNVYVPEGTKTVFDRVAPDCPCDEVADASDDARRYADTFPPSSPAHALVMTGASAIETAGLGGYDTLAGGLAAAVGPFTEARLHGADEFVLDDIMRRASTALDVGVERELAFHTGSDPSTGGSYTDPDVVVFTDSMVAAQDHLDQARALALVPGPLERWVDALLEYELAVQSVFAVDDEIVLLMEDDACTSEGSIPGSCCLADLDLDGRLTIFDFLVFQNLFATGDLTADFDGDGSLTLFDFLAFQNAFDAGCL